MDQQQLNQEEKWFKHGKPTPKYLYLCYQQELVV